MYETSDKAKTCSCALCTFGRMMDEATEFEMFYCLEWEHADYVSTLYDPEEYAESMEYFANVQTRSSVFN